MINRVFSYGLSILSGCILAACSTSPEAPYSLMCEYLSEPLGIDMSSPRLSWKIPVVKTDSVKSCRVWVSADSMAVINGSGQCWDSGELPSDIRRIVYAGDSLQSWTKYYWKVGYKTKREDRFVCSLLSSFTTGMMSPQEWGDARWISDGHDKDYRPSPYFRKDFEVRRNVKHAYAVIAAAGLYELSVNGSRIGDHFLDPMYTHFDKRVLSVMYNITPNLSEGENVIGVQLGNGWYNHQSTAVWFFDKASWRNRPAFIMQVRVEYADGSIETISTDSSWVTTDSPVIFNSIYTAEHYDARQEIEGWNTSGIDVSQWKNAKEVSAPTQRIEAQLTVPVKEIVRHNASRFVKINDTCFVYHFPENMAGTVELSVEGKAGIVLRLKHGEMLNEDGTVNLANIDYHYRPIDDSDPFQTDIVILRDRETRFTPKFNYKGFQYVEVTSSEPIALDENSIVALKMHSDVPEIGRFRSSSDLLNKIWTATNNSYLDNLFGYPTDCPQREKNGWTGDAHIAIETALYNFDAITVYEKWLLDFIDEQRENGVYPCIVPTSVWGFDWANGVDWTSASIIIPWEIYRFYGDETLMRRMYPSAKKYVAYIESISKDNLTDWGLGDWIPVRSKSDVTLTTSIYYYTDVSIMAKAAKLFGYVDDAVYYEALADRIKESINDRYLDKETGLYASGTQTELAMPLYWNIVPDGYREKVAEQLNRRVVQDSCHIDVGLLGSKALLGALSDNGYPETAYRVATQETYPSWGYWIKNGATTLHENWRIDVVIDNSLNHIMFGEIGAWLYKTLGGLRIDESNPAFRHVSLRPYFPENLDYLEIEHETPYGCISTSWKRDDEGNILYEFDLPECVSATFTPLGDNVTYNGDTIFFAGSHKLKLETATH